MKKFKLLLVLLLCLFLSGCTINYDVDKISDKYDEKLVIKVKKDELSKVTDSPNEYFKQYITLYKSFDSKLEDYLNIEEESDAYIIRYTKKYDSIKDLNNSVIFKQNNMKLVDSKKNIFTRQLKFNVNFDSYQYFSKSGEEDENAIAIDELNLNLSVSFKTSNDNADYKNNNTYSWKLKDSKDGVNNFFIEYYKFSFGIEDLFILIGLSVFIAIIIIGIKIKKNDEED